MKIRCEMTRHVGDIRSTDAIEIEWPAHPGDQNAVNLAQAAFALLRQHDEAWVGEAEEEPLQSRG